MNETPTTYFSRFPLATRAGRRLAVAAALLAALGVAGAAPQASAAPRPASLQRTVDRWARAAVLRGLDVGVSVLALDGSGDRAGRAADRVLNPASGAKLLTTAAALTTLPPAWRPVTRVFGDVDAAGRLTTAAVLVGGGDPKLLPAQVDRLAAAVAAAGITSIPAGIAVDAGLFAPPMVPPAYDQKPSPAGYRASVGAAGSNFGAVRVVVRPGRRAGQAARVSVVPVTAAVVVDNRAVTAAARGAGVTVTVAALPQGRTRLVVRGAIGRRDKRFGERRRVADPDIFTGWLLHDALKRAGVEVGGEVRRVHADEKRPRRQLARLEGPPLDELLRDTNVWSNNFMAETLFKHLGSPTGGGPATWEAAQRATTTALVALGLDRESLRVVNGSGLYDATRIAPAAMTRLLARLHRDDALRARFVATLAVSGQPGTLRRRLRGRLAGRVRAKTGTLDGVVSLSGYLTTRSGRELAFSVIVNGANPGLTGALRRHIDRLVGKLALP